MKIVTLMGSPRSQGNSNTLTRRFQETAATLGAEIRNFELNRLTYRGCQGCYTCKKGLEQCSLNDDLTEVLAAVVESDAVVLATPVYYGDMTAQLKGFMDRTYSYLKPDYLTNPSPSRLSRKKLVFVITQGHPDETLFADIFPRYDGFLKWLGFSESHLLRVCGVGPARDSLPEATLLQADELARQLVGGKNDLLAF